MIAYENFVHIGKYSNRIRPISSEIKIVAFLELGDFTRFSPEPEWRIFQNS
ncbi:hypothetical protein [Leptospira mayottensis]|uniref:hypothetical protein n=1 Tax=Leptospira mayottensis TaxID=1137606 RepID=UPI0003170FAB|nr:hypothetical protein [Leptospira mayottensis]